MTNSWMSVLMVLSLGLMAPAKKTVLCQGFLPENDMQIPVRIHQVGGISLADFNAVLDQVEKFYGPYIQARGATLQLERNWTSSVVNASANQFGNNWVIKMYGGLARHPLMNKDGFALVACHEAGHHLGGAPKDDWASIEGQADYYATLHCLHNLFSEADNAQFVTENEIPAELQAKCDQLFATIAERNLCMREGMAGLVAARLFRDLRQESSEPSFTTPDPSEVGQTDSRHPGTQCRLDTYYAGAKCTVDRNSEPVSGDASVAACTPGNQSVDGSRPRCWFAP